MSEKRGKLSMPVNGGDTAVPSALHPSGPKCHEVVLQFEDARRSGADVIAIDRRRHGLLSAHDIRGVREHFDVTQAAVARSCGRARTRSRAGSRGRNALLKQSLNHMCEDLRDLPEKLFNFTVIESKSEPRGQA
jgi:hypothetical protein